MSGVISPSLGLSPQRPFPDDCLAKFKPERELASGGYGAIYLARQESLDRLVAVKLLLGHVLKDADQIQRFIAEARITASIQHPHVVTVIDHGAEYRVPWIAYEYLPGPSLRASLSNGPLSPREAARAAQQVAEALDAAHALDVLHRDVKPDNVIAAGPGHWKVADFGIARWADDARVKTGTGLILGTPAYIAPEQVTGDEPSRASDIYALGVMLFELVTGRLPFDADNPLKLLELQVHGQVPLASQVNANVPPELERLILKAMAKKPQERFATAREMADTLAMFLAAPERPLREGSGRSRRPTAKALTARVTRPTSAIAVVAPPAPRRWIAGVLAAGAALLAAAFALRPAPVSPRPSVAASVAPPVEPSRDDDPSKWLPPLAAQLAKEAPKYEHDPGIVRTWRATLDRIWARAGANGHRLTDAVLIATADDLYWRHYELKRRRGEFFKSRQVEPLRAAAAADYKRALARSQALIEACLQRPGVSFAVTARVAVHGAALAHKYYKDVDVGARAAHLARTRSWIAKNPQHPLCVLLGPLVANFDDSVDPASWTPALLSAERAVDAADMDSMRSWYVLLRAAIQVGGGRHGKHVTRVGELEVKLRPRFQPWIDKEREPFDRFRDQQMMAATGLTEMEM